MSIDQKKEACIIEELIQQLPDEKFSKPQLKFGVEPHINVAATMEEALVDPIYYPPLNDSVFPGDSIAIVLQSNLPQPRAILATLVGILSDSGIELADVIVVITTSTADQLGIDHQHYEISEELKTEGKRPQVFPLEVGFHSINFQVHDPENQSGLAYLLANEEGEPIYVNRLLVDADVIVPVGFPTAGEISQQTNCIYPDFGSSEIKHRFAQGKGSFGSRWHEIELVNDAIGAFFAIQVACGPGDSLQQIFSGARKDATDRALAATNRLWTFDWTGESGVTVGTIETNADDQTWDDFANALIASSKVTQSEAPIIIWSDIGVNPDRKTRKACMSQFEEGISPKLTKTMQHVAAIINERPVYLRSGLKRNTVEELGLGFIESAAEITRIAEPCAKGLLIRDAHKCQIKNRNQTDDEGSQ